LEVPRILIVDPSATDRARFRQALTAEGFETADAGDGQTALGALEERAADLVLTDWRLADMSGSELIDRIQARNGDGGEPTAKVLVVASSAEGSVVAAALGQGADDFMAKSGSSKELVARVRAALRRPPCQFANAKGVSLVGPVRLEKLTHRVTVDGTPIELAPAEYRLIAFLMENPGRVYDRQHLLEKVWHRRNGIGERTVDVHVRRLRALLEPHGCADLLQTIRGFGYRFGD
jgi:two-component system phosphate regulon response regulator PhoB